MSVSVLQFLEEILRAAPDGAQLEVLEREVARRLGRPVARGNLQQLLARNSERFEQKAGGQWRLRSQSESAEEGLTEPAIARTPLPRGRYIVFDLETLGREAES